MLSDTVNGMCVLCVILKRLFLLTIATAKLSLSRKKIVSKLTVKVILCLQHLFTTTTSILLYLNANAPGTGGHLQAPAHQVDCFHLQNGLHHFYTTIVAVGFHDQLVALFYC